MPLQLAAAFLGTAAFALLFYVPARHYLSCGLTGALGWGCYLALQPALSAPEAAFCAAALAALRAEWGLAEPDDTTLEAAEEA